jgi:glycosyltransferase involved in cell wall biosynthesis
VFVGGEWQRKGLRSALEALAQAPMWTLVVAGTGDESAYRALAHELNVAESVYWLGPVRDIPVVYELGDAFVLPSRYETFSLVTYEAAASGLPLLATPVHGVRDLVRDGENGFFIDEGPASLAARLNQLGENASRRMRMGEAARRDALQFGWIQMCESQFELFRTLARESSRGRAHVIAADTI